LVLELADRVTFVLTVVLTVALMLVLAVLVGGALVVATALGWRLWLLSRLST
jgi:hypothetical protein